MLSRSRSLTLEVVGYLCRKAWKRVTDGRHPSMHLLLKKKDDAFLSFPSPAAGAETRRLRGGGGPKKSTPGLGKTSDLISIQNFPLKLFVSRTPEKIHSFSFASPWLIPLLNLPSPSALSTPHCHPPSTLLVTPFPTPHHHVPSVLHLQLSPPRNLRILSSRIGRTPTFQNGTKLDTTLLPPSRFASPPSPSPPPSSHTTYPHHPRLYRIASRGTHSQQSWLPPPRRSTFENQDRRSIFDQEKVQISRRTRW